MPIPVSLALQGGGAHGAFTWGVLDTLLADPDLDIQAITGTSAGAMNAVVLAEGMLEGGAAGARTQLRRFWDQIGAEGALSPMQRTLWDRLSGNWSLDNTPGFLMLDAIRAYVSPYDFNPLNLNPLRGFLERVVDFGRVRRHSDMKLFVSATNVRSGKVKVFSCGELTADMVMASACLPQLFQAVEIDGEAYWDGGFMGNPALFPLFYDTTPHDVILVQINPIRREEVPRTARDITNRQNEITFNGALLRELRAIAFVDRLVERGHLEERHYRRVRMHRIASDETMVPLSASSKFNTEAAFLDHLFKAGQDAAGRFLTEHRANIGQRGTLDLGKEIG